MNALEALKLARETGAKVRPKGFANGLYVAEMLDVGFRGVFTICNEDGALSNGALIYFGSLVDPDGNPVEWEIAPRT